MTGTTSTSRSRAALGMDAPDPGKTVVTPTDKRITLLRQMEPQFADAMLRGSGIDASVIVRDAITAVRTTPKLVEATPESFLGALMTAAQLGLRPNVASIGHGWVLPYWSGRNQRMEANWILGYQGMVELAYRSGLVSKVTAHTIYSNEPHRISWGTEDELRHEPVLDRDARGEAIWHYAVVWLKTGGVIWNAITELDAQDIRDAHAARDRQRNIVGPWKDDYMAMARKTALRGLWRFMPKTPALSLALDTDGALREGMDKGAVVTDEQPLQATVERVDVPDAPAPEPEPQLTPEQLADRQADEAYMEDQRRRAEDEAGR